VDTTRFPTPGHLVSWAKSSPITHQSAARSRPGATGRGNPWIAATLGEVVIGLSRSNTFLGKRYRRLSGRIGKKRALVAVGNSVLKIIWHLLSDPDTRYTEPGPDFHDSRRSTYHQERDLIRRLEHLTGKKAALQPAA
jgi:hypothetical protein